MRQVRARYENGALLPAKLLPLKQGEDVSIVVLRQAEETGNLTPIVEDALTLRKDGDPAATRLRERTLGLEEQVLDALGPVRAAPHVGR